MPARGDTSFALKPENLRVVVVYNLFDESEAPELSDGAARTVWEDQMTDELWAECCRHGEVRLPLRAMMSRRALRVVARAAMDAATCNFRCPPSPHRTFPRRAPGTAPS